MCCACLISCVRCVCCAGLIQQAMALGMDAEVSLLTQQLHNRQRALEQAALQVSLDEYTFIMIYDWIPLSLAEAP